MLNPASKTFSLKKLSGLCKSQPAGISFIPPSAPRQAFPPVRAMQSQGSASQTSSSSFLMGNERTMMSFAPTNSAPKNIRM